MNVDNRYSLLRNKLDTLGFTQPLPIGALSIVSAILDDLVLTTNSLKRAKEEITQLQEVHLLLNAIYRKNECLAFFHINNIHFRKKLHGIWEQNH